VSPKTFGTFDLVLFYGVLYHLRHPLLALEKILGVCTGTMLLQTKTADDPAVADGPWARFHPFGTQSGPDPDQACEEFFDPTVFWLPNHACVTAMVASAGFVDTEVVCADPRIAIVVRARSPVIAPGTAPDQMTAPWS
jgi:tRNA (mo5U34)-methyltransferase